MLRGYLRCDLGRESWRTDVRVVDSIAVRQSPVRTGASFAMAAGTSTLVPA
jgi:alkaline phosphatase D